MKPVKLLMLILALVPALCRAQDSVSARMIFIGDAGEMSPAQSRVISGAAARVIAGKTTVMFLGDNIYPRGMSLADDHSRGESILRSQFVPLSAAGARVFFVPGNHDWDRMGPDGLGKIKAQWRFITALDDSLVKFVPPDGCPDPVAIPVTDSVVIVAWDSEWWVFPYDKDNAGADCDCSTERDVVNAFREILYRNRGKTIILAMHHPFYSDGVHGGHFTWKDYFFPLTAVKPHLYVPLPGIGAIYPVYRKLFPNPEDLSHPLYKQMIKDVSGVFSAYPNVILASGHDHGLQLIDHPSTNRLQIVSGGGSKSNPVGKGKYSLYSAAREGYVVADAMRDGSGRVRVFALKGDTLSRAYTYRWHPRPYAAHADTLAAELRGDSVTAAAHPAYNRTGWFSRVWFGENYRREWAAPVRLPVIRVSDVDGGLTPEKLGGGFQSTSLRMKNPAGIEYTLRSVEKSPDKVLPQAFQGTFARQVMDDATSGQHPYSALIVPPIATALGVPHATPEIGVVSPDRNLGMYQRLFAGRVTLLERREPLGNSDNFLKATDKLLEDNDNSYDAVNFTRARMIDLLLGDWDRHGDQWRFYDEKKGKGKYYVGIPRDRDMVLNVTEGVLPTLVKRFFLLPHVTGFQKNLLPGARYYLYKSRFLSAFPASQLSRAQWMDQAYYFRRTVTDSVLDQALRRMPGGIYRMDSARLTTDLRHRRDQLPEAISRYYDFSNRIVDIRTSDKNEFVRVTGEPDSNAVTVLVRKITKHGALDDTLMRKTYPRSLTRELRIYVSGGDDSVVVDAPRSTVHLRIIGGKGHKAYNILDSRRRVKLYDRERDAWYGDTSRLRARLSKDSANTAFVPTDLYNTTMPLVTAAINADDGLYLGLGALRTGRRGFRRTPYSSRQKILVSHSFSTEAFNVRFSSEWIHALGTADIVVDGEARAPNNTQNFFGRGNQTFFDKTGDYKRYYRTRFNLYDITTGLRWRGGKGSSLVVGPSFEYYHYDADDNKGRFTQQVSMIGSYDSATIASDRAHLGLEATYTLDQRNNEMLPAYGAYVRVRAAAFTGLNGASRSFVKLSPELALYKSLTSRQNVVFADRVGGEVSIGHTAFYQSAFLGGEGNLLGYRKYRFAGQQSLYNNAEVRVRLANFGNYILKGQLGAAGFYDVGRVWQSGENARKWHQGVGGGLYFVPAYMAVFRLYAGYSPEGWYPYFSMGMRF
jgi:hypothetical protein